MNSNINWFKKIADQWHIYREPIIPSFGEVALMKKVMRTGARVLVLGATPRYRDLGHELKCEVVACDMNLEMLVSTSRLMKYSYKSAAETWVIANWLETPLKTNYFDYILGDFVISNIPLNLRSQFYLEIKRLLKKDGLFITRHIMLDHNLKASAVVTHYADQKDPNICEFQFAMQSVVWNKKLKQFDLRSVRQIIKQMIRKQALSNRRKYKILYQRFIADYPFEKTWFQDAEINEEKKLKKYFQITAKKHASDHRLSYLCPVYFLKKK